MLSDEEREALRNFKSEYETCDHYSSDLIIELDDAEIILNLIEELKEKNEKLERKIKRVLIYLDWIDDDMMKCCSIVDINGIDIIKILKEE